MHLTVLERRVGDLISCQNDGKGPTVIAGKALESFAEVDLPCAHLIHAGFSLPFCPPQEFPALWGRIRRALAPGGVFAGQLFGTRDTWADDPDLVDAVAGFQP